MTDWPSVSVVFVAYNRQTELAISLQHVLEELDYPADRLEVIVVDNASVDDTATMVRERFPSVRLIRNPENVGASAWNVGMSTAAGDWRLILDDDCYLTGDALKTSVRHAAEADADLVSYLIASSEEPGFFNDGARSPGLLGFVGCAALFSRRFVEAEPFYDPRLFIWGNELELTMRLLDGGYRHLFLPEVAPVHQKPLPKPGLALRFALVNYRHWAYSAGKLLAPGDAVRVLGRLILRAVIDAAREDPRLLRSLSGMLSGFADGLRHRRPLRPEVSELYRQACVDFSNPLALLRTPVQRVAGWRSAGARDDARARRRAEWEHRVRSYYPTERAVLDVASSR